jgi:HD-GYP domain-containing protein (c-di-GMP phosphodiesterase class II)
MLSLDERAIVETHPVKGGLHLMKLAGIPKIVIFSTYKHHLKFDGTGYPAPSGQAGNQALSRK